MKPSQMPEDCARVQRRGVRVPLIEVADHADGVGVRRPDGEGDARRAVDAGHVRAELLVDARVGTLVEQVQVEIR